MRHQPIHKSDNSTRIVIATSNEHIMDAFAVRSICFMDEKGIPARSIFDGNDFQSTHIVVYSGDEPIGTSRVRWFSNFVKIERTAFRKAYRNPRILRETANFIFAHAARKGYRKALTLAEPRYASVWVRLLGFKTVPDRAPTVLADGEQYIELFKEFGEDVESLTESADPRILLRVEGYWDRPSQLETSAAGGRA
jgi:hypothetical protein